ncbi:MAG: response regulator [Dehalococcoidales bacterium]|jgi:excisionase family DNA binding protein
MSELMTLEEVANYLRVNEKTIYRLLNEDDIPAMKVGRQWRFDRETIYKWLHQNSTKNKASILVIDDDEIICSLFKDALEETGHTITTVSESSRALELLKYQDFDLVFLDLMMPVMDGAETFRQIRMTKPKLPVTIITGYPDSDLMMKALAHGPLGVMSKPFSSSDILTAVNNYLRFGMINK